METPSAMMQFIQFLGAFKLPLFILAAIVLGQLLIKVYHYFIKQIPEKSGLNAILFWGGVTVLTGMIGQLSAIWELLRAVMEAPDISPQILLVGFLSSFSPTLFGLVVGLFSALAWWAMRYRLSEMQKNTGH